MSIKRAVHGVLIMGLIAVAMLMIGVILLFKENSSGWCIVALSIPLIAACSIGVLDRRPRLIINNEGLYVRALGGDTIPWSQIQTTKEKRVPRAGSIIVLGLYDGSSREFDATWLEQKPSIILQEINKWVSKVAR